MDQAPTIGSANSTSTDSTSSTGNAEIHCVAPQGRLDALSVPEFENDLRSQLSQGSAHIIVNFQDVTYISSSGLRALLTARRIAKNQGGDVKLCQLSLRVYEIFEMVGFTQVFGIYDSLEAAQTAFS
jgi:anti-sigma B factor antagonist